MSQATQRSDASPEATTGTASSASIVSELRASYAIHKTRTLRWRFDQLNAVEQMIVDNERSILEALRADLGKPGLEAYTAEVAYTLSELRLMRKNLRSWVRPEKVTTPIMAQPGKSRLYKDPLGVVLVIAPWNYPFQLALGPLIGAIAAGNCAVLKPSEISANTSALIADLCRRYLDQDCLRVVEGGVPETTDLLEQRWDHIFYTGNGVVGRIVMTAAAKHLTPVTLELGGKSPAIVGRSADLDAATRRIAWGKFWNCGQTCVAPDYVLVHEHVHDRFIAQMRSVVREFYGDDAQASPDFGRIINEHHFQRLQKLLGSGDIAIGGQVDPTDRFISPTVLVNVPHDAPIMGEEIFGPILPVITIRDVDDAIAFVNARPKPLAMYIFAKDRVAQQRIIGRTSAGGVTVNHAWLHLAVPGLPFGGVGESGMGAYHGKRTFDTFTHEKSVLVKSTLVDPPLLYPPYSEIKERWIKRLL